MTNRNFSDCQIPSYSPCKFKSNPHLKIEFTDKEIMPWDGMVLMKKLIEKTKIIEELKHLLFSIGTRPKQSRRRE
jgi:hypothetical protein